MSTTQQLHTIYQTLSELTISELDEVMQKIVVLRRQKLPTVLPETETDLLKKINTGAPTVIQKRYDVLIKKRIKEQLSNEEHQELLELTAYMENVSVRRLEYLTELSKLRNEPLDETLQRLQIKPKLYVV